MIFGSHFVFFSQCVGVAELESLKSRGEIYLQYLYFFGELGTITIRLARMHAPT